MENKYRFLDFILYLKEVAMYVVFSGSNPHCLVQIHLLLLQGGIHLAAAYIHNLRSVGVPDIMGKDYAEAGLVSLKSESLVDFLKF